MKSKLDNNEWLRGVRDSSKDGIERIISGFCKYSFILLVAYVLILSMIYISTDTFESPVPSFWKEFGFLGFVSVGPWLYLKYWAWKMKSKLLCLSFFLGSIVIVFNAIVALCYSNQWFSWCAPCAGDPKDYFPLLMTLLPSILYGAICVNSCFYGLRIQKNNSFNESFSNFRILSVFISIAAILYFFLLGNLGKYSGLQFDPFLISFMFLAIALSVLYVIIGYFSRDGDNEAKPILFLMSTTVCFSIGFTLSVFVLQYERVTGTLISHWVFLCIFTLFLASTPLLLAESMTRISDYIDWIFKFLDLNEINNGD